MSRPLIESRKVRNFVKIRKFGHRSGLRFLAFFGIKNIQIENSNNMFFIQMTLQLSINNHIYRTPFVLLPLMLMNSRLFNVYTSTHYKSIFNCKAIYTDQKENKRKEEEKSVVYLSRSAKWAVQIKSRSVIHFSSKTKYCK